MLTNLQISVVVFVCAVIVHLWSRFIIGKQADWYFGGILSIAIILVVFSKVTWLIIPAAIIGHFASVIFCKYLGDRKKARN